MNNETQYCIMTGHDEFKNVITWICDHNLRSEVHLNRTRFWVPHDFEDEFFTSGMHKYCPIVHDDEDLISGKRFTLA